jgi:hypothetical protein
MPEARYCSLIGDFCNAQYCINVETETTCPDVVTTLGKTIAEYAQTHGLDPTQIRTWSQDHQEFVGMLAGAIFEMVPEPAFTTGLNLHSTHQALTQEALKHLNNPSPPNP